MRLSFGPGALDMLLIAKQNQSNDDYSVYLEGDLCQMSAQKNFLMRHGISVKHNGVYPCVKPCDKKKVFQLLWDYKADGWWHYDVHYYKLEICTREEFRKALDRQCEKSEEEWQREKKEKGVEARKKHRNTLTP